LDDLLLFFVLFRHQDPSPSPALLLDFATIKHRRLAEEVSNFNAVPSFLALLLIHSPSNICMIK
jgi:hypothetical protein